MAYFHGVYNSEIDTSLTAPIQGSAGLQVIFGTAPIHLSRDPAAAVNKPMLCYSFAECQQNVGYSDNFKDFTLCQSIDACFRVFNVAPIILVNVLDPGKASHTTVNAAEDCPVADGQVVYKKPYAVPVRLDPFAILVNVDHGAAGPAQVVIRNGFRCAPGDLNGKNAIIITNAAGFVFLANFKLCHFYLPPCFFIFALLLWRRAGVRLPACLLGL